MIVVDGDNDDVGDDVNAAANGDRDNDDCAASSRLFSSLIRWSSTNGISLINEHVLNNNFLFASQTLCH